MLLLYPYERTTRGESITPRVNSRNVGVPDASWQGSRACPSRGKVRRSSRIRYCRIPCVRRSPGSSNESEPRRDSLRQPQGTATMVAASRAVRVVRCAQAVRSSAAGGFEPWRGGSSRLVVHRSREPELGSAAARSIAGSATSTRGAPSGRGEPDPSPARNGLVADLVGRDRSPWATPTSRPDDRPHVLNNSGGRGVRSALETL